MHGTSIKRHLLVVLVSVAAGVVAGCRPAGANPAPTGEALYQGCVNCHGAKAEGVAAFEAPALAGLPQWYVEAQLRKFRNGHRAYHFDDDTGLRMRPMSRQLAGDAELVAVAAHVAKLPAPKPAATLKGGDEDAGKTAYGVCIACHGPTGAGNQALNAPPVTGQHDWYLLAQLKKFKAGHRGTAAGDASGATMRPMAMTLPDEQAMKNVVAYIATLSR